MSSGIEGRLVLPGAGAVSLLVNNMLYEGWTRVEVARSIKEMASQFSIQVAERWSTPELAIAQSAAWQIHAGDACVLLFDGVPVVTGHVDAYQPHYTGTLHEVAIQGRSKTGDLCDCSALLPTGELNNVTFDQMVRTAVAKYGINVVVDASIEGPISKVSVHPGETVHELFERYARPEAIALTDNPKGELVLKHVQAGGADATLIEGINILEGAAVLREDNRFSEYHVKGQESGAGDRQYGKDAAQVKAKAADPSVKRHRPLMLLNETKTSRQAARSRGAWEKTARAGESTRAEISVVDWFRAPGKLWMPGDRAMVVSPWLQLNRILAVESTRFVQDENGTVTKLALVPPEALNPKGASSGSTGGDGKWDTSKPGEYPQP